MCVDSKLVSDVSKDMYTSYHNTCVNDETLLLSFYDKKASMLFMSGIYNIIWNND